MPQSRPLHLFISYAHEDDPYRRELETHLIALKRQGLIKIWSDRAIEAGQEWEKSISEQLEAADIILLLISSDFLASEYIYNRELKRAVERHNASQARVIPVFLRPCDWKGTPFGKLQGVPDNAKSISQWRNLDEAFNHVTQAVRRAAESLSEKSDQTQYIDLSPRPQAQDDAVRGTFRAGSESLYPLETQTPIQNTHSNKGIKATTFWAWLGAGVAVTIAIGLSATFIYFNKPVPIDCFMNARSSIAACGNINLGNTKINGSD